MGVKEDLLSKWLQLKTPCLIVCDNISPYGIGPYDIKTGLNLPELPSNGGGGDDQLTNAIIIGPNTYLHVGNNEYLKYT